MARPTQIQVAASKRAIADPQDLHWAMHAVVRACPREHYDAYDLPKLPSGPAIAWSDGERTVGRRPVVPDLPIFGVPPPRRAPANRSAKPKGPQ